MSEVSVSTGSGGFTLDGRVVDAGRPVEWLKRGWEAFTKNPGVWIAVTLIAGVIMIILAVALHVIGQLVAQFLGILFVAGLLLGAKSLAEGGELRVDHLFAGFKQNTNNLLVLGVFYLIGCAVVIGAMFLIGGGAAVSGAMVGHMAGAGLALGGMLLGFLVGLALTVPLAMAIWFAPALVVFRNVAPLDAMKSSFNVCLKNLVPFLVYGVILFVLFFVAAIPFGLGFLVLMPVLVGAQYASYVDLYE
ncbi:MAG TPA: BPSS1780 family membrane protein [Rhodocyclaceae bacterium]|nr:BPSS1780 family membrane protein [Rhodocyclaceae bacterium]